MQKLADYYKQIMGEDMPEYMLQQFETYYEMLIEKNKVMNLTAITEKDEVELKHFIDSIALAKFFGEIKTANIIDVGTGAGFPGLPLAIAFPNTKVTLLDSLNKRVNFLNEVIEKLNLGDRVCAIHSRAEEGGRNAKYRDKYDVVVSRAVSNMAVLTEYCLPFAKVGGYFIPYKSGEIDDELNDAKKAIKLLGGRLDKVDKMNLFDSDISRSFIYVKKEKPTPKAYPRKAGTASKEPLK